MDEGLIAFIVVVVLNVCGLLLDWSIYLAAGYDYTVTALVQSNSSLGLAVGVVIILLQLVGTVGLAYHFWGEP